MLRSPQCALLSVLVFTLPLGGQENAADPPSVPEIRNLTGEDAQRADEVWGRRERRLSEAKTWLRGLTRQEADLVAMALAKLELRGKGPLEKPITPRSPAAAVPADQEHPYAHPYLLGRLYTGWRPRLIDRPCGA